MIRAIILSLVLVIGLATIIPIATEYAEAGSKRKRTYKKKRYNKKYRGKKRRSVRRKKRVKRYSKRWWKAYRARKSKRQAIAKRKRNLRLRQIRLARQNGGVDTTTYASSNEPKPRSKKTATLPTGEKAPKSWTNAQSTKSEARFDVADGNGSASISVVGPAVGEDSDRPRNKAIGGVPVTSLRRTVIDKMIRENGWVVNDYQKQVGGKTVYVVVAQSEGKGGKTQSHVYYFTQVDGRIYNVAASAPKGSSEQIAEESEKVINSLQRRTTASNK